MTSFVDAVSFLDAVKAILASSDCDLNLAQKYISSEIKCRKHKGEQITTYEQIRELASKSGSVLWTRGGNARGFSAAFVLNNNYSNVQSAINNKQLFVYKK